MHWPPANPPAGTAWPLPSRTIVNPIGPNPLERSAAPTPAIGSRFPSSLWVKIPNPEIHLQVLPSGGALATGTVFCTAATTLITHLLPDGVVELFVHGDAEAFLVSKLGMEIIGHSPDQYVDAACVGVTSAIP